MQREEIHAVVKEILESEEMKSIIGNHVKLNFKELIGMLSVPFMGITLPLAGFVIFLVWGQFEEQQTTTKDLAKEINNLSVAVGKLQVK